MNTTTTATLPVCEFCNKTGSNGALWIVSIDGQKSCRVHKPCGEILCTNAPKGAKVTLQPSQEQRMKWKAERQAADSARFWEAAGLKLPQPQKKVVKPQVPQSVPEAIDG